MGYVIATHTWNVWRLCTENKCYAGKHYKTYDNFCGTGTMCVKDNGRFWETNSAGQIRIKHGSPWRRLLIRKQCITSGAPTNAPTYAPTNAPTNTPTNAPTGGPCEDHTECAPGEKCKGGYKLAKKCRQKKKDCKRWGHHSVKRWGCAEGESCTGGEPNAKWGSCVNGG